MILSRVLCCSETDVPGRPSVEMAGSREKVLGVVREKPSRGSFTKFGNWIKGWNSLQFLVLNDHEQAKQKQKQKQKHCNLYGDVCSGKWWYCVKKSFYMAAIFWTTGKKKIQKSPHTKPHHLKHSLLNMLLLKTWSAAFPGKNKSKCLIRKCLIEWPFSAYFRLGDRRTVQSQGRAFWPPQPER